MKKVILLAGLFLMGISAQAITNHQKDVVSTPGTNKRYNNTQQITFVENGILFTVSTSGYFDYYVLNRNARNNYRRGNNNHAVNYRNNRRGNHYNNNRREYVQRDYYGNITQINRTPISYSKKGRVKYIGDVRLKYENGRLEKVGNLKIKYNRFGEIRDTFGYVNSHNNFWHDGCNLSNEDHWEHHRNDRKHKNDDDDDDFDDDDDYHRSDKVKNRRN